VVPGINVTDESSLARRWADLNQLDHEVIDISWEDIVTAAKVCMKQKGAPIHSIEAQSTLLLRKLVKKGKKTLSWAKMQILSMGNEWSFSQGLAVWRVCGQIYLCDAV